MGIYRLIQTSAFRTIRAKLSLAAVICILVPAVLTMLSYNALTQQAVERQARDNAVDAMRLVNGTVDNVFQGMLNILNFIQVNPDMNAYFKQLVREPSDASDDYGRFTASNRVLQQLDSVTVLGEKSYITVILTNGITFTNYSKDEVDPLIYLKEPWFNELKALSGLQSFWVGPRPTMFPYDRPDSPYQISVARTLRLDSSRIYGYVVVTMMETKVSRIFDGLTSGQSVVLVDGQGKVLSSPKARINVPFDYWGRLDSHAAAPVSSVIRDQGKKMLLTSAKLSFNDWHLVATQPYETAILNISAIFKRVLVFQLVSFFFFLLLLLIFMRAFTKPLIKLGKVSSAVQRGNLEVRSGVRGSDEIGRLGFLFDQMLDRIKEMLAEVSRTQARKRKAELAMLQAQINPHFLFNVLNSIRMKVMRGGDAESAKMIASLSKLLRMTISREEDAITLHEEFELLAHYVDLMNARQKEEVVLAVEADPGVFDVRVPRFILQPLVENALIHGLNRSAGTIRVRAEIEAKTLELTIEDDGAGMDVAGLRRLRAGFDGEADGLDGRQERGAGRMAGIGAANVAERMRMMYGEGIRIEADSQPGRGTRIRLNIPLSEEGN
ncbi:cache domain-containing sensor histidine kinase [Paenibacillus xanthanilyticus]|uniref:histidine kinase n=1 Tax=Paenibacillus xanthanilyticus TaxID=1783531 RepID=A0ABV8K7G1_9BACL